MRGAASTSDGIRVDALGAPAPTPSSLTPAHQHPTGVVLAGERRTALLAWLRERDAIAIEDDYDAEYRYDRAAVGALQGLEPDRVVYAGSASKTLAPALRLGWLVRAGARSSTPSAREKVLADRGTAGSSSTRSPTSSRAASSTATCAACAPRTARAATRSSRRSRAELPEATVHGVAAGLHVTVRLPDGVDEAAIRARGARAAASRSRR